MDNSDLQFFLSTFLSLPVEYGMLELEGTSDFTTITSLHRSGLFPISMSLAPPWDQEECPSLNWEFPKSSDESY